MDKGQCPHCEQMITTENGGQHWPFSKCYAPPSAGVRRSESGEAFLGENDYRETLIEQQDYLRRLKHRADVRGGPDVSAMGIADEAIARIEELLDGHKPPSATEASIKEKVASWFAAYDDGRWDADDVIINVAHALGIKPPEILKDATVGPGGVKP